MFTICKAVHQSHLPRMTHLPTMTMILETVRMPALAATPRPDHQAPRQYLPSPPQTVFYTTSPSRTTAGATSRNSAWAPTGACCARRSATASDFCRSTRTAANSATCIRPNPKNCAIWNWSCVTGTRCWRRGSRRRTVSWRQGASTGRWCFISPGYDETELLGVRSHQVDAPVFSYMFLVWWSWNNPRNAGLPFKFQPKWLEVVWACVAQWNKGADL